MPFIQKNKSVNDGKLFLILHNIRSAYNVGAIFRTADGAGVAKIYLSGYTALPAPGKKIYETKAAKMIAKTALGAEKSVEWEKIEELERLVERLKKEKIKIIALENYQGAKNIKDFKPVFPAALILGNEVEGVDLKILDQSDAVVAIPMRGEKESLNVSVAAGIAVYEFLK